MDLKIINSQENPNKELVKLTKLLIEKKVVTEKEVKDKVLKK